MVFFIYKIRTFALQYIILYDKQRDYTLKGCSDYLCLLPKWGKNIDTAEKELFFSLAKSIRFV